MEELGSGGRLGNGHTHSGQCNGLGNGERTVDVSLILLECIMCFGKWLVECLTLSLIACFGLLFG